MAVVRSRLRFPLAAAITALLVSLLIPSVPAAAEPGGSWTELDVREITPSVVEGGSPDMLTISGQLTNTSDRHLRDLKARVERGEPSQSDSAARQALSGPTQTSAQSGFQPLPATLAPGASVPFRIQVPITGPGSMQMSRQGTYPVLLNINGTLGSGSNVRVGEGHFTVPVLSPPGSPPSRPPRPTPTSMLIPIVDYPRMEHEGVRTERSILVDDALADSLRPGGRLFGLVQGVRDGVRPGSPLGTSLCFGVDPDLLATVGKMQSGYDVRQPDGSLRPGSGSDAAGRWLDQLRDATRGRCVFALPYADADVAALGRANLPDLIKGSLDESRIVQQTLRTAPREDLFWPIGGALNRPATNELSNRGVRTAFLRPEALAGPADTLMPAPVRGSAITAQPVDPLLSHAMDPERMDDPSSTAPSPPENGVFAVQNTLGALAFRATLGSKDGARTVMAPPRHWNLNGNDLRALFAGMEQLTKAGYLDPTGLPENSGNNAPTGPSNPPKQPPMELSYPVTARSEEIPERVLDTLASSNFKVGDLYVSSVNDPQINIDRGEMTTPLRNGLLRGASSAWRGHPGAAQYWVDKASDNLRATLEGIQVATMPQVSRTWSNSTIPVTVSSQLPVATYVHLRIQSPSGIKIDDLGMLRIPPRGSRTFFLSSDIQRSGRVSIDVQATTARGTELGTPARMQLDSSVYGVVTLGITIAAGVLLFLLSARRVVRRIRARRAGGAGPEEAQAERTEPIPEVPVDPSADTIEIVTTDSDRKST